MNNVEKKLQYASSEDIGNNYVFLKDKVEECKKLPVSLASLGEYYKTDGMLIEAIDYLQKNCTALDVQGWEVEQLFDLRADVAKMIALAVLLKGSDYTAYVNNLILHGRAIDSLYEHYEEEQKLEAEVSNFIEGIYHQSMDAKLEQYKERLLVVRDRKSAIYNELYHSADQCIGHMFLLESIHWTDLFNSLLRWKNPKEVPVFL